MSRERGKKHRFAAAAAVLAVLLLLGAGAYLAVDNIRLESVTVEGDTRYSGEELLNLIFPEEGDRRTFLVWLREHRGEHRQIPYISRYEITLTGLHSAEIMAYGKNIVACLEYMGNILYFDKDGIVVESDTANTEGVPLVTGIAFSRMVMYEPIAVEDSTVFRDILRLTQLIAEHRLDVERIYYHSDLKARLYMGGIRVELGDSEFLDEKIMELSAMYPQLKDRSGTLYLDHYDPDSINPQYRFRPDRQEAETGAQTQGETPPE